MITLYDIKYFCQVARAGSLRKAAEALHVTQPALSHSVRKLEAEAGALLFERKKKGVTLTREGELFLEKAREILDAWIRITGKVSAGRRALEGHVVIGCHPSVARYALPGPLARFLRRNMGVEVRLFHDLSRNVTRAIIDSRVDVGVVVNPVPHPDLIVRPLGFDEVTLWRRPDRRCPDVLIYDPELAQSQWILRALDRMKRRFPRHIESGNLEVIASLVHGGAGVGILPSRLLKGFKAERCPAAPSYRDKICLAYKPAFRSRDLGRRIIDELEKDWGAGRGARKSVDRPGGG